MTHNSATAEWSPDLEHWLRTQAREAGFDTAGVAPVASPQHPDEQRPDEQLDADRFAAWIAAGRAGEMDYLKRRDPHGVLLRSTVQTAIPWARSVIVCALNYNAPGPLSIDHAPPNTGWIARYAWSGSPAPSASPISDETDANVLHPTDYHDQLLTKLHHLEAALHQRLPCQTKCYVDTGPVVERTVAARAGIGWIGKNTCLLNQQLGSWLLLGVIVTSISASEIPVSETPHEAVPLQPAADRCGTCTRCIDACPTNAIVAPREMDATRCIAYLTIEKKGTIAEDLRPLMGRQVFGCDICQDVCPWNRRAPIAINETMQPRTELVNPPSTGSPENGRTCLPPLVQRLSSSEPEKRLHRNVAIAMGNSGDQQFLPQLEAWSTAEDKEDEVLADAAKWAATRIRSESPENVAKNLSKCLRN